MKGAVKALPLSDIFYSINENSPVYLSSPEGTCETRYVRSLKKLNKHIIISFYDINDLENAAKLRNYIVLIEKNMLPALKEGEFFYDQIIGLDVFSAEGVFLGKVHEIFETGSNDVYVIKNMDKEYLIPAIKDVINKIDLQGRMIVVNVIEGLLD